MTAATSRPFALYASMVSDTSCSARDSASEFSAVWESSGYASIGKVTDGQSNAGTSSYIAFSMIFHSRYSKEFITL
jgi:hypothetical protein